MAVLAWFGRRIESAGSRAVASQGAAADEWQALYVQAKTDLEDKDAELTDRAELWAQEKAQLLREIGGLEQRLEGYGLPVRRRPRVPGSTVFDREQS